MLIMKQKFREVYFFFKLSYFSDYFVLLFFKLREDSFWGLLSGWPSNFTTKNPNSIYGFLYVYSDWLLLALNFKRDFIRFISWYLVLFWGSEFRYKFITKVVINTHIGWGNKWLLIKFEFRGLVSFLALVSLGVSYQ